MPNKNIATLSGNALKQMLEYIAPDDTAEQLESEITLVEKDEFVSTDGEPMKVGYYICMTEYPEEGLFGPLEQ